MWRETNSICEFCECAIGTGNVWAPMNKIDVGGHRVYKSKPCPICVGWVPSESFKLPRAAYTHIEIPASERLSFHSETRSFRSCEALYTWDEVKQMRTRVVECN